MTPNRKVTAGSAIVGFFVLVAIFGPLFARQDPLKFTRDLLAAAIRRALARHQSRRAGCLQPSS